MSILHPQASRHILCVDDDPELLETLESILMRLFPDHIVTTAGNSADAKAQALKLELLEHPIALIMTDQILGDGLGTTLLQELTPRYPNTAKVVMTGYANIKSAVQGLRAGVDDFLEKPLKEADLRRSLTPLLKRFDITQAQALLNQQRRATSLRFSRLLELTFRGIDGPLQALMAQKDEFELVESDLRKAQENLAVLWRIVEAQRDDRERDQDYISARELTEEAALALTRGGEMGLALDEPLPLEIVESAQRAVLFGERAILRMALERILHNAWRFNPEGESVMVIIRGPGFSLPPEEDVAPYPREVAQALKENCVVISISNGGHLQENNHHRILASIDRSGHKPLVGLGLVVAQEFIITQRGAIYYDGAPGDEGVAFHIVLPSAASGS